MWPITGAQGCTVCCAYPQPLVAPRQYRRCVRHLAFLHAQILRSKISAAAQSKGNNWHCRPCQVSAPALGRPEVSRSLRFALGIGVAAAEFLEEGGGTGEGLLRGGQRPLRSRQLAPDSRQLDVRCRRSWLPGRRQAPQQDRRLHCSSVDLQQCMHQEIFIRALHKRIFPPGLLLAASVLPAAGKLIHPIRFR